MLELTLQAIFTGVLMGAMYALIALGLALVFGTMKVINLAHGELVLLAAYIAFTMESMLGWNPLAAIPVAFVVVTLCAALIYFLVERIRQDRELNSLILTFGVAIILTNAVLLTWSADIQGTAWAWVHDAVVLAGGMLFVNNSLLLAAVIGIVLAILLYFWLNHTWYGRAIRAVSSRPDAAKLMGVNPRSVELMSFLVAGLLATFAGVAIYLTETIDPNLGHSLTITAFIITVLAGMGSIWGVVVGGILIGVIEALTVTWISSSLRELGAMILFLLVLFLMPSGLSGITASIKRVKGS